MQPIYHGLGKLVAPTVWLIKLIKNRDMDGHEMISIAKNRCHSQGDGLIDGHIF